MFRPFALLLLTVASISSAAAAEIDFAHDIVPVLRTYCGQCHTGDKKQGGFSMNTRELLLAGGEGGMVGGMPVLRGNHQAGFVLERAA